MFKMSCRYFSIRPVSPENIRSARASNGPPGILVQRKAGKMLPTLNLTGTIDNRFFGFNKAKGGFWKAALALVVGLISIGIWSAFYMVLPVAIIGWAIRTRWNQFK